MRDKLELIVVKLIKSLHINPKSYSISNITKNTTGWETDIYFFTLTIDNNHYEYALRIYIGERENAISNANKEYKILQTLYIKNYPVPKVALIDDSMNIFPNPVVIMDKINGETLMDILFQKEEISYPLYQKFFQLFYQLHNIPLADFEFLYDSLDYTSQTSFVQIIINILEQRIINFKKHELNQILIIELEKLMEWSSFQIKEFNSTVYSLVHLDFHPGNILVDQKNKFFIIDWNACSIGNFQADIAWTQILCLPNENLFESIPKEYQMISNQKINDLDLFIILMGLRRLTDAILTIELSDENLTMKKDTINKMKNNSKHYIAIVNKMESLTSFHLPFLFNYFYKLV